MTKPSKKINKALPPDPTGVNEIHAKLANRAIKASLGPFWDHEGWDEEDNETKVADLLTNLGHWCDRNKVDLHAALVRGERIYIAETDHRGQHWGLDLDSVDQQWGSELSRTKVGGAQEK